MLDRRTRLRLLTGHTTKYYTAWFDGKIEYFREAKQRDSPVLPAKAMHKFQATLKVHFSNIMLSMITVPCCSIH